MVERHHIVPPIYFLGALLAAGVLHWCVPIATIVPAPVNLLGALLVPTGLMVTLSGARLFQSARTPIRPFEQSTALVTDGIYRYTRNPMYLGMVVILLGVALLLGTVAAFLPIPLFAWQIQRKFVVPEEAFLEEIFGREYLDYKARVRRWL